MGSYTVANREDAYDFMAQYPGFGEMRSFTGGLGSEQVALTWRTMPPGTGGKGSYGHRHKTQEEVYFVVSGTVLFKLGDEEVEVGPRTAVRIPPELVRSVHNEGPEEAELVICSVKVDDPAADVEQVEGFWPAD